MESWIAEQEGSGEVEAEAHDDVPVLVPNMEGEGNDEGKGTC